MAKRVTSVPRLLSGLNPARMPVKPELTLCELVNKPPNERDWIFEPKLDGLRILAYFRRGGEVTLISRNDKPQDLQFPDVIAALHAACRGVPLLVDGEIVCLDDDGKSSFRKLQQRFHLTDPKR